MKHLSVSVDTSDLAAAFDNDGDMLADLLNEMARRGGYSPSFLKEFAQELDEDGRKLFQQLHGAIDADDAEHAAIAASEAAGVLLAAAKEVMNLLQKHGPSIVPHLMDSDQNAGQRLRLAIATAEGR